jgi:hypothetical protein
VLSFYGLFSAQLQPASKNPSESNGGAIEQNDISWGEHFCVSDNLFNEGKYPSLLLCPLVHLFMAHELLQFGALNHCLPSLFN